MIPLVRHRLCYVGMLLALAFSVVMNGRAHDVGLSIATVRVQADKVQIELGFAIPDVRALVALDADHDGKVTTNEFMLAQSELNERIAAKCSMHCDGEAIAPDSVQCTLDGSDNVTARLNFPGRQCNALHISFDVIREMTPGHRMFATMLGPQGETLAERLVSQAAPDISLARGPEGAAEEKKPPQTFLGFLKLGIEHIVTGYDHLLFLLGLLLVARGLKSALAVITSFTLAHSITLAAATLDLFALGPALAEPLIALSIVYVGLENLWSRGEPGRRWMLAFAFGLIHGFGFASVLCNLGVGSATGVALPLLSFNLGVELGQAALAAILLPVIWKLRRWEKFSSRFVPVGCIGIAAAGGWWFCERVWMAR